MNSLVDDAPLIRTGATFTCNDIRLYPNQFLIGPETVDGLDGWQSVFVDADVIITHHPDLSVTQVHGSLVSLTLLGYILDPKNPIDDDESILIKLVSGFSRFDQLIKDTGRYGGRWVMLARSAGQTRLFNDALGLRQVFYTRQSYRGGIWAGSQPGMLAECLQLQIDGTALEFMDFFAFRSHAEYRWPAAGTAFHEIRHLLPNHWLDMLTGRDTRYWPHRRRAHINPDAAVDKLVQLLPGMIQAAARRFDIALGITAGWDSRLVLAASRDISDAIDYVTVRQGKMADTADDILVPSRLLRRLGLQHTVIKALPTMSPDFSYRFKRSVYLAHDHYGGDAEALLSWTGRRKVAMTGGGAEIGRCSFRSQLPHADRRPITAADLARLQHMGDSSFAVAEFQHWLDDLGDLRDYKLLDLFEWEQGHGNWLAMTQLEFDSAWRDIFTPYNCRELLDTLLSVEERYRISPDYLLGRMTIARLWREVLDEPVNPAKAATRKKPIRPVGRGLSTLRDLFMRTRQVASAMPREQAAPASGLRERMKRIAPLRAAVLMIRQRINRYRVPAWVIKGRERDSGQPLSLLFVGNPGSRNYFDRLVFGDTVTEQHHAMLWKRGFPKSIRNSRRGHDIAIVHLDAQADPAIEAGMKSLGFRLPSWVGAEKDLSGAAEFARHSKQVKSDLWRIRKNHLGYRVTREPAEFDRFYHTMYLPYIQRVFGDRACLMTYSEMQNAIPNSELFLVTQDGQDIAGGILVYDTSDRVRGWSLGVKNGDDHWLSQGALGAFVQLQTDYLHDRGYRSLHAGALRPFLNDGALRFKKNRGMVICDRHAHTFVILPLRDSAGTRAFLQNNPFIFDDDGELKGAVFITGQATAETASRLHHDWYIHGLKTLDIFRLDVGGAEHMAIRKCGYVDSTGRLNTTA